MHRSRGQKEYFDGERQVERWLFASLDELSCTGGERSQAGDWLLCGKRLSAAGGDYPISFKYIPIWARVTFTHGSVTQHSVGVKLFASRCQRFRGCRHLQPLTSWRLPVKCHCACAPPPSLPAQANSYFESWKIFIDRSTFSPITSAITLTQVPTEIYPMAFEFSLATRRIKLAINRPVDGLSAF